MQPGVDLITAGWPCQDLSVAGKRAGLAGERSGLFREVCRVADAVRPRWLLLENVPGLLSSHAGRDFAAVLGALDDLGFDAEWRVLDAQHFGVPQRRRRVYIVGHHRDRPDPGTVLLESEGRPGHPAPVRRAGEDVAHCLDGRSGGCSGKEQQETLVVNCDATPKTACDVAMTLRPDGGARGRSGGAQYVAQTLRSGSGGNSNPPGFSSDYLPLVCAGVAPTLDHFGGGSAGQSFSAGALVAQALTGDAYADGIGEEGKLLVARPLRARDGKGVGWSDDHSNLLAHNVAGASKHGRNPDVMDYVVAGVHANQRGEARLSALAGSLTKDRSGKQFEGVLAQGVRRLTPLECERLQGFPDNWTDCDLSDTARYRLIGNAVAVPVIEWIGRRFPEPLTFGELFAGIGGFRLGLERAGHTCLWANELSADACKVRRAHWPDEDLIEGDVRGVFREAAEAAG